MLTTRFDSLETQSTMKKLTLATIVVTFNRAQLLEELLVSLMRQTRAIDVIYVVDNCSTDGTSELMLSLVKQYHQIKYIKQSENLGGSGGFYRGVKQAYEDRYDWLWLLDDDLEALPNAIEMLLKYTSLSGCIHGRRQHHDRSNYFWQVRFFESIGYWLPVLGNIFKRSPIYQINTGCFEGMFISRETIQKIGYPDPRFFITWDDAIYGWLASKVTSVLYINEFVLIRKRVLKSVNLGFRDLSSASDLYRYYTIKNRLIVKEYLISKDVYSPIGFNIGSLLIFVKELIRIALVDRSLVSLTLLFRGYDDQLAFDVIDKEVNNSL